VRYGWVESIEMVRGQPADTSGVGAVIGGVAGGLLGHQVGGGRGNTIATIGGAVAGAVAGNAVEKQTNTGPAAYRVRVRTNDSGYLTLTQASPYNLRSGDRVKIQNGVAVPY
jgi:outer membrane lipoprotein SlyB